jgi:hypothetical protein
MGVPYAIADISALLRCARRKEADLYRVAGGFRMRQSEARIRTAMRSRSWNVLKTKNVHGRVGKRSRRLYVAAADRPNFSMQGRETFQFTNRV